MGSVANGDAATGVGAPKDVGYGDADAKGGGNGVPLDNDAVADWPSELVSRRLGSLWRCLRPVVFFLIFAAVLGDGGCKFNTSGPD